MWPKTPVKRRYDPLSKFTLLLALFTLLLAVLTGVQVLAFIESERAELSVSGANVLDENGLNGVLIEITNSGKSTATNGHVRYYGRKQKLPSVPDYNNPLVMAFAPIVPGGHVLPVVDLNISPSEMEQTPFFIYGIVTYSDGYSKLLGFRTFGPKEVGFCLHYRKIPSLKVLFETCSEKAYSYSR